MADNRNRVSITLSDREYALLSSVAGQMGIKVAQLVHNATFEAVPMMYNRFSATLEAAKKADAMDLKQLSMNKAVQISKKITKKR